MTHLQFDYLHARMFDWNYLILLRYPMYLFLFKATKWSVSQAQLSLLNAWCQGAFRTSLLAPFIMALHAISWTS
jgi:hypothetical protein